MFKAELNESIVSNVKHYGHHRVLVLDGVFKNVDEIRSYAIDNALRFAAPRNGSYPGLVLHVQIVDQCFKTLFREHIADFFSTVPVAKAKHRLGITNVAEGNLTRVQCKPHRDVEQSSKFIRELAAVTYLFDQPSLGGTSFYSDVTSQGQLESADCNKKKHSGKSLRPSYIISSNSNFRLDGISPAVYNRLVIFESNKLHSGHIDNPSLLSDDFQCGRITLNSFFSAITR